MLLSAQYNHTTGNLSTVWSEAVDVDDYSQVVFTTNLGARRVLNTVVSGSGTTTIVYTTSAGVGIDVPLRLQAPWAYPFNFWVSVVTGGPPFGNDPIANFPITQV